MQKIIDHRYQLQQLIGEGGMGAVFLATDILKGNQQIALKMIKKESSGQDAIFKREFEVMTRLQHPNLAGVHDFGLDRETNTYYITMEYVRGVSLAKYLASNTPLPLEQALEVCVQTCRALDFIHSRDILHRDIKPGNIMLNFQSEDVFFVKIMDFGLADLGHRDDHRRKGTLMYMAPEILISAGEFGPAVDLYALGITLFEMISTEGLFPVGQSNTVVSLLRNQQKFVQNHKVALENIQNLALREIIAKLTAYYPHDRYQSGAEVILDMNRRFKQRFPVETAETRVSYVTSNAFVGRRAEMAELTNYIHHTPEKVPLFLIQGKVGLGKRRLMREIKTYCRLHDIPYYEGFCLPHVEKTYSPFVDIVYDSLSSASTSLVEKHGPTLKKLVPSHDRLQTTDVWPTQDPQTERGMLIETIAQFLIDWAVELHERLVIYLPDLHHADEGTVAVLNELLFKLTSDSGAKAARNFIRVFATAVIDSDSAPVNILAELEQKERIHHFSISPFDPETIQVYISATFGPRWVDDSLRQAVTQLNQWVGGNPLFLQELIKNLVDNEIITRPGQNWQLAQPIDDRIQPENIKDILKQRLVRLNLSPDARLTLEILALLNDAIRFERLQLFTQGAINSPLVEILGDLERAELIVTERIEGMIFYQIPQFLWRSVIVDQMEKPDFWHGHIAKTLEQVYWDHLHDYLDELAYHFQRSPEPEKALPYLEKVALKARELYANQKALTAYDQILNLLGEPPGEKHLPFLIQKANVYDLRGQWDESLALFKQTLAIAEKTGSELHQAHALAGIGSICQEKGDFEPARIHLDQAQALYEKLGDEEGVLKTLTYQNTIFLKTSDYARALTGYQRQIKLAEQSNHKKYLCKAHAHLGILYRRQADYEQALKSYQAQLKLARQIPEKRDECTAYCNIGVVHWELGHYHIALEHFTQYLQISEAIGDKYNQAVAMGNLGEAYFTIGELKKAKNYFDRHYQLALELNDKISLSYVLHNLATLHKEREDYTLAWELYSQAIDLAEETQTKYYHCQYRYARAELLARQCQWTRCLTEVRQAIRIAQEVNHAETIFQGSLLENQAVYYLDHESKEALARIKAMVSGDLDDPHAAQVYDILYQLTGENSYRQKAVDLYIDLYRRTPNSRYKMRIDAMKWTHLITLQRYNVVKKLGEGGMGAVYLAEDRHKNHQMVAIKTIKQELINPRVLKSFKKEFEVMTRLRHPNLARVYDFGWDTQTSLYYITMEFLGHTSLRDYLKSHSHIPEGTVVEWMIDICRALNFIHTRSIIHRDIKPGNIMLVDDQLKIMDFGLADLEADEAAKTKGTLHYMAPEVLQRQVDERADIFAAGVVFYELLTGHPLFTTDETNSLISVLKDQHRYIYQAKMRIDEIENPGLRLVIARMTAYETENRYRSGHEVIYAIASQIGQRIPLETAGTQRAYIIGAGFVGRQKEYAEIIRQIESPAKNQLMVITGARGIGKHRLMHEVKKYAQLNNIAFYQGHFSEKICRPFAPFLEILDEMLFVTKTEMIETYGPQLKKLMPEHERLAEIQALPITDPKAERGLLITQVAAFLLEMSQILNSAMVIHLSHIEHADPESLDVINEILYRCHRQRSRVNSIKLFATSDQELTAGFYHTLQEKRRLREIILAPFDEAEVKQFLESTFGRETLHKSLQEVIPEIVARVGGNPFFLQELIRSLVENKYIVPDRTNWQLVGSLTEISPPETLHEIMSHRLEQIQLTDAEWDTLTVMAALTRTTSRSMMELIIDTESAAHLPALFQRLVENEIIVLDHSDPDQPYHFQHQLIREVILHRAVNLMNWHARIAQKLESLNQTEEFVDALAYHYSLTIDAEKAVFYLKIAGENAKAHFSNKLALSYFQQALNFLGPKQKDEQVELLLTITDLMELTGEWNESLRTTMKALAIAAQPDQKAACFYRLGRIYFNLGELDKADDYLQQAIEKYTDHPVELAQCHAQLGSNASRRGLYDQAEHHFQEQKAIADQLNHPRLQQGVLYSLAHLHQSRSNFAEAKRLYQQTLTKSIELNDLDGRMRANLNLGICQRNLGNHDSAREHYLAAQEIAQQIDNKKAISIITGNLGILYEIGGNNQEAIAAYQTKLQMCEEMGDRHGQANAIGNMGIAYEREGKYSQARECFHRQLEISQSIQENESVMIALGRLGHNYQNCQQNAKAHSYLDQAIKIGDEFGFSYFQSVFMLYKADLLLHEHQLAAAQKIVDDTEAIINFKKSSELDFELFRIRQKISFYLAQTPASRQLVIDNILAYIKKIDNDIYKAGLFDNLFNLTSEKEYGQQALELYEKIQAEAPRASHKKAIDQLKYALGKFQDDLTSEAILPEDIRTIKFYKDLLAIVRELNSYSGFRELIERLVDLALRFVDGDRGLMLVYNDEGDETLRIARDRTRGSLSADEFQMSQTVLRQVLETGKSVFVADVENMADLDPSQSINDLNLQSIMCLPLGRRFYKADSVADRRSHSYPAARQFQAVLYVDSQHPQTASRFQGENLTWLEALADQAAVILTNAALYQKLNIDPMTGLFLRPYFEENLRGQLRQCRELGLNLAVFRMAIDQQHALLDRLGQRGADALLKIVGEAINGVTRENDACGRYSTDQLVLMVADVDAEQAYLVAQKIKNQVSAQTEVEEHLTISIGLSLYPEHITDLAMDLAETANQLLAYADQALAHAQHAGREQIIIFAPDMINVQEQRHFVTDILTGDPIRDYRHVQMLLEAIQSTGSTLEPRVLLEQILDMIIEITTTERGLLLLVDEQNQLSVQVARTANKQDLEGQLVYSQSIPREVLEKGQPVFYKDISHESLTFSMVDLQLHSVLCIPLKVRDRSLGVIYLDSQSELIHFTNSEIAFFHALTAQIAGAIETTRLHTQILEKERLGRELAIAGQIQLALLPKQIPPVPGLAIAGRMETAQAVGGDYYDIIFSPDRQRCYITIADVSGKGVPAGLLMVQVRTLLQALTAQGLSLPDIVREINDRIYPDINAMNQPMFVTMVLLCWDIPTQKLTFVGAGHEYILHYRAEYETPDQIKSGGMWLGIQPDIQPFLAEVELKLQPDDSILLYTDGVTEYHDPFQDMFGLERLVKFYKGHGSLAPAEMIDRLFLTLENFGQTTAQFDDVTVVALKRLNS